MRQLILITLTTIMLTLLGCGPIYSTDYTFTPPPQRGGMQCVQSCINMKQSCKNNCANQQQLCTVTNAVANSLAHNNSYNSNAYCHANCGCEENYRTCYASCGGTVTPHRKCTAFCGK